MPVINGVYLKDFAALPSSVTDANIIPIAIAGNQIAYRTTVSGIITDARITGKLLTGLSVTGTAILATDTILEAFGKVQNQLNNRVSSVGLTMPTAFSVANSPVTTSGTIAVTAAGLASQYIRGDGTLADFPTGGGGGGSSVSYYLNGSVNQGSFGGNTYYEMNKTPVLGAGTDFNISSNGYIAQFITDTNDPNSLLIPAGNWNLEFYFNASSSGGTPSYYVELYKYNGSTFTLIASNSTNPELIAFGTTINPYFSNLAVPETVLTATDRLAIRIYVTNSGKTITLHTEDNHLCEVITTFTTGVQSLNGLSKQAQFFATGSSGTDFAIISSIDTHTFNIPSASATARGLITTGTQTIAGDKTFSSDLIVNGLKVGRGSGNISSNILFGNYSLSSNTTGYFNTVIGNYSLSSNLIGYNNTSIGTYSLYANTANNNTSVGVYSLLTNTIGTSNTSIGYNSGATHTTGDNNIFIGANSIGVSGSESNRTWIGNTSTTSTWVAGILLVGNTSISGSAKVQVTGDGIFTGTTTLGVLKGIATTGFGVSGEATSGNGVTGNVSTGIGGSFIANGTGGVGLIADSYTGVIAKFQAGGSDKVTISNTGALSGTSATFSGDVTVGTTSVGKQINVYASSYGSNGLFNAYGTDGNIKLQMGGLSNTNAFIYTGAGNSLSLWAGAAERLTISSGGNVGIATTSPGLRLETMGVNSLPATSGTSQTGVARFSQSAGQSVMDAFVNGSVGAGFQVTNSSNLALNYPLLLNPNGGNVGIGTTSPSNILHLYKATYPILTIQSSAYQSSLGIDTSTGLLVLNNESNAALAFNTNNTTRLTIASTGAATFSSSVNNIGLNASPTTTGTGVSYVEWRNTGGDFYLGRESSSAGGFFTGSSAYADVWYGTNAMQVIIGNVKRFEIATSGAITISNLAGTGSRTVTADASGVLSASSDSRLKREDLNYKISGLSELMQIQPRAYKWLKDIEIRGEEAETEIGFFANEVNPIIPSAAPMGNDGMYGFYDRAMIATMVKAIQELKAEIDILKNN